MLRVLAIPVVALAALFLATVLWITLDGLLARPRRADVAIVLGNKVLASGEPSRRLVARLEAARRVYAERLVGAVIVSGGLADGHDEAKVMKAWLVAHHVPAQAIVTDSGGANTALTARHARTLMTEHGWTSAVIVSQYFHITRIRLACRRAGVPVVGATAPLFFERRDLWSVPREVIGFYAYLLGARGM